jgi:transcriptional regulator with XRE-family HTH domain
MNTLKQLRQSQSITQVDLAEKIKQIRGGGAYQGPVSAIEANKNSPTVLRLHDTLKALGFELKVLAVKDAQSTELDVQSLLGPL